MRIECAKFRATGWLHNNGRRTDAQPRRGYRR
jgi:hypothetical protein